MRFGSKEFWITYKKKRKGLHRPWSHDFHQWNLSLLFLLFCYVIVIIMINIIINISSPSLLLLWIWIFFFYNLCLFFPLLKIYHCDRIRGIWNIFTLRDQKKWALEFSVPCRFSMTRRRHCRGYAWLEFISIMHGSTLEISAVLYLSSFYRTRNRYLHFTSRTFVADVEFSVWFLRGVLEFARKIKRAPGLKVTR